MLAADAQWFPARFDAANGAIRFDRLDRSAHAGVTFLDEEYLAPLNLEKATASVASLDRELQRPGQPLHYVFHSAFAASTLLARALDVPGRSLGLKEPQVLNDVAQALRVGAVDQRAFATLLSLLARPYAPGEINVVKPSNVVNVMAPALLDADARSKAVFLYAPLARFLRSIADKGLFGRRWGRRLFAQLSADTGLDFGLPESERFELTDLQAASLGWMMHHAQAASLMDQFPDRVRSIDSETFLARRSETLGTLSDFFGLGIDDAEASEIANGDVFKTHSKELGRAFDPEQPLQPKAAVPIFDEEIGMIEKWVEAVAASAGLPMELPRQSRLFR